MGNNQAKFLTEIDKISKQGPPHDVWSKIADGADGVTQKLFFEWIEKTREKARKTAAKEKLHASVSGTVVVSNIKITDLPEDAQYKLELRAQNETKKVASPSGKYTEKTKNPSWEAEQTEFSISGKGIAVEFRLHKKEIFSGLIPAAQCSWYIDPKHPKAEVTLDLKSAVVMGKDRVAKLSFTAEFTPTLKASTGDRGFIYNPILPVLASLPVPMPDLAKPTKSFTQQDESMKHIMYAVAIDWMVTGALNTRKTLPQPLQDRVDDGEGDEWWTNRRLNGDCAGFIRANSGKTETEPWDYYIEWDFTTWIDPSIHVKSGVSYPIYACARFILSEDKQSLIPHSIKYLKPGQEAIVQMNDSSAKWKKAKAMWRSLEMNIQFTWTHVGVHFNVEQYAMALYRNLSEGSEIWNLLTPHFENVISNNREVVAPLPDGVVTRANIYTYDGQIRMLQERFSHFSYRTVPTRVLPTTISNNMFENAQDIMWSMINTYVDEYFTAHPSISVNDEIQRMSNDLVEHALNKDKDAMKIRDVDDLRLLCKYVIFQAIFYHAWVHWNNYDDFAPTLIFDKESTVLPKDWQKLEDQSNMIQTFVELVSPTLKQWPIVDPEFGGPDRLKELLWQNASKINPNIMISTLIMAPNA